MIPLYQVNGLVHWSQREIEAREWMIGYLAAEVADFLRGQNKAWDIERVEAPIMLPLGLVNANYTEQDLWTFRPHDSTETPLVARPETTPSTYVYMVHRLQSHEGVRLPYCCWQVGKSFRAEQDKVLKHMRLKEFYQMEFQCAFGADTMNDYHAKSLEPMRKALSMITGLPTRIVESDRLPDYSLTTMDVEVDMGDRWMEVCSISKRKDFPIKNRFQGKDKVWKETDVLVLEVAVGLDRCIAARNLRRESA